MDNNSLAQDVTLALVGVSTAVATAYGLQKLVQRYKPEWIEESDGLMDNKSEVRKALKTLGLAVGIGMVANLTAQAVTAQFESVVFGNNEIPDASAEEVFPTS